MTRQRLLVAAASVFALAALPTSASAFDLVQGTPTLSGPGWSDQVLVPGENVAVQLPFTNLPGGVKFRGGTISGMTLVSPSSYTETTGLATRPLSSSESTLQADTPYELHLENSPALQCGQNIEFAVNVRESALPNDEANFDYSIPTGVRGAYKRQYSHDGNEPLPEYGVITSNLEVPVGAGGRVKGLKINVDALVHDYFTNSLVITLVAPSGKKVILFNGVGRDGSVVGSNPTKTLENVIFDDAATVTATDIVNNPNGEFAGRIKPFQTLSDFDGEPSQGTWHLEVTDSLAAGAVRSGTRGTKDTRGRAKAPRVVGQLGEWSMDLANAKPCDQDLTTPSAWFGGPDPLIVRPAGGILDATGSTGADGRSAAESNLSYSWDFGNNGSVDSNIAKPMIDHTALPGGQTKGTVAVRLTVTQGGKTSTVIRNVVITEPPVIGDIEVSPLVAEADKPITLTVPGWPATNDPDGTTNTIADIANVAWDYDLDGVFEETGTFGTKASTTHTWDSPGDKIVRVRLTDTDGATTYTTIVVQIANQKPTARFGVVTSPLIAGKPFEVTGAASTDPDGEIATYQWSINKGLTASGIFGDALTTPKTTLVASEPGTYTVRLQVTDDTGDTNDLVKQVLILPPAPVAALSASNGTPAQNETVTFTASVGDLSDVAGYQWNLGGRGFGPTTSSNTSSYAYPNAGGVDALVKVIARTGDTSTSTMRVNVKSGGGTGGNNPGGGTGVTGGGALAPIPNAIVNNPIPGTNPNKLADGGFGGSLPPAEGRAEDGFTASLSASSKQKTKKAIKSGFKAAAKLNAPGKMTVKVMLTAKAAKKLGIKLKTTGKKKKESKAPIAIGSGSVTLKKAGSGKFVIKIKKKYASKVKRAKAVAVTLRGVATSVDKSRVAVGRKTTFKR